MLYCIYMHQPFISNKHVQLASGLCTKFCLTCPSQLCVLNTLKRYSPISCIILCIARKYCVQWTMHEWVIGQIFKHRNFQFQWYSYCFYNIRFSPRCGTSHYQVVRKDFAWIILAFKTNWYDRLSTGQEKRVMVWNLLIMISLVEIRLKNK